MASESVTDNTEQEVFHLHIGSAGIEIGNLSWQLYCLEHNLNADGCSQSESNLNCSSSMLFLGIMWR